MRRLLLILLGLLLAPISSAQVTNLQQVGATSTTITMSWSYSPSVTDCLVGAKLDDGSGNYSTDPNPVAFDVDPTLFTNANDQQDRYSALQVGTQRIFIIGTQVTPGDLYQDVTLTGIRDSRALQQNAAYIVQISGCGSTVTTEAYTAQLPTGITWPLTTPLAGGGSYAFPTPPFTIGGSLIDPNTGVLMKEVTAPGFNENTKTQAFGENGTCTNWTSPASMWDGSGTATYSATTNDPCSLTFGGTAGLTTFNFAVGNFQFDGYQIAVTGFASTSGENLDVCFTYNGTSCTGNTVQFALPTTSGTTTLPTTITPIDETFIPYAFYEGSTAGTSTGGGGNGIVYNQNFGVLVWKASSDSSTISITKVEMTLSYSQQFYPWDGGENIPCGVTPVLDDEGNSYSLCKFETKGAAYYLFAINNITGNAVSLGVIQAGGVDVTFNSKEYFGVNCGGTHMGSSYAPLTYYCTATDASSGGKYHLLSCTLPASGSSYYRTGSGGGCSSVGTWADLTPTTGDVLYDPSSTSDSLVDLFTIAQGCQNIPTSGFPCFTGTQSDTTEQLFSGAGVQSTQSHYVFLSATDGQDTLGWFIAVDVSTSPPTIVGMMNTWSNATTRWQAFHTYHEPGDTSWWLGANGTQLDGSGAAYAGPYGMILQAAMTATQTFACVDTNIPSMTDTGGAGGVMNQLMPVAAGDVASIGSFTSEKVGISSVYAEGAGPNCTSTQYQLTVSRGVLGSTAATHSVDAVVYMHPANSNYPASGDLLGAWNPLLAPTGDLPGTNPDNFFYGPYSPYTFPCSYSSPCDNNNTIISMSGHESYVNGFDIGESAEGHYNECVGMSSVGDLGPPQNCNLVAVPYTTPFAGYYGNITTINLGSGIFEDHPAGPQYSPSTSLQGDFEGADENIINSPYTFFTCGTATVVTGTLYKCTPTTAPNYKAGGPFIVVDGVHPLNDVSGPSSSIGGTSSDYYHYCYVYAAGECQSGSAAGTLYANDPNWTSAPSTCSFNGNSGAQAFPSFYTDTTICVGQSQQILNVTNEIALLGQADAIGQFYRPLTGALSRFGRFNGFATSHLFGFGLWVTSDFADYGTDAAGNSSPHEDTWVVEVPPWNPQSPLQDDYVSVTVTVPSPPSGLGVATAQVEFGYDQNARCTSFGDKCVAVNSTYSTATPFYFETTDTYTRATCSSGCVIQVPVIPNMTVFYQVKLYNSSGTLVSTLPMQTASVL